MIELGSAGISGSMHGNARASVPGADLQLGRRDGPKPSRAQREQGRNTICPQRN